MCYTINSSSKVWCQYLFWVITNSVHAFKAEEVEGSTLNKSDHCVLFLIFCMHYCNCRQGICLPRSASWNLKLIILFIRAPKAPCGLQTSYHANYTAKLAPSLICKHHHSCLTGTLFLYSWVQRRVGSYIKTWAPWPIRWAFEPSFGIWLSTWLNLPVIVHGTFK